MDSSIKKFENLIEDLSRKHKVVQHSDDKCHFASTLDDAQNKHARKMHYPCVLLDKGDFTYSSVGADIGKRRTVTLLFVDHCKDVGNSKMIDGIFDSMEGVCDDFMKKLMELSRSSAPSNRFLKRFSLEGVEGTRIVLESPALYGWAVIIQQADILCPQDGEESPWLE